MRPLLFNPARAGDEELEATLVARGALLDDLQRAIVADAAGPSVRHWLIVAPRGSGKSHVTEVLARRMRRVAGWSVVRLPEEAYRVSRVADLLAWVVGALEGVPRPFADEDDPARIEALAEARLRRWRAERGPILVILENLHDLLGRRFDRRAQARLRALLMGDPPFALVATSTRMFDEVTSHGAPFYDFFQERRLDELSAYEVADLVERRARFDQATELLDRLDEVRPRIAALYHLSGGNPRLVVALYGVLRQGLTRELYDQLVQLLDEVTPYYQARLRDASPQGERVLAEMAMAEGPLVPSELGRRCGLKTNQVTAVLAQLQEERFVRPGGRPRDKRARFWEVTDRLFRIWLQMREEGDPTATMRWIVEFYQRWYADDFEGLVQDAGRLVASAWTKDVAALEDAQRTLRHLCAGLPAGLAGLVGGLILGFDLDDLLGPNAGLARLEAGLPVEDTGTLRAWLAEHLADRGVAESIGHALTAHFESADSDHELARVESVIPDDQVAIHAVIRGLRAWNAHTRKWPFDASKPHPLDPAAVTAAWEATSPAVVRAFGPHMVHAYAALRDLGILPPLSPWTEAARVLGADEREAELAALHPEVREAVLLLIGGA